MPKPKTKPKAPRPRLRSNAAVALRALAQIQPAADGTKARTFRMVANTGEPMRIWPYENPVVVDLASIDLSGLPLPALYDHCPDADFIVGQVQAGRVQGSELVTEGPFVPPPANTPPERDYHAKVLARADAGYQWQVSVGGDPTSVEEVKAGASVMVNGRTYPGPVCVARGLVLREISFVVLGGDRRTSAVVASNGGSAMEFDQFVQSLGFDPSALDETQTANMTVMFNEKYGGAAEETAAEGEEEEVAAEGEDEEMTAEGEEEEVAAEGETATEEEVPTSAAAKKPALRGKAKQRVEQEIRATAARELARCRAINALTARHGNPSIKVKAADGKVKSVPLNEHAIEAGWGEDRVKAKLLDHVRGTRPSGPGVIVKGHEKDCTIQALQGAMILRAGGRLDHPAYQSPKALNFNIPAYLRRGLNDADRNRFMEASHRYRDMSLVDVARECLRIDGKQIPHTREETIQAAFSGSTLTNVFTTDVNAILLPSYMEAEDTTAGWVTEEDVADYNTMDRPRVLIGDGLEPLPESKTATHADYADTKEQYKVTRFARQWVVDEIAMVNDRLDALSDIPRRFGEAAAWLRPDMVYGEILANNTLAQDSTALFSATHPNPTQANLLTSAALAADKLKAAIKAQYLFTENGKTLNLRTTHLIVPPSLKWTALELANSAQIIIAGTAGSVTERGVNNTLQQENLTVVVDGRLENGVTHPVTRAAHSGSASTWYVASTLAHTMVVGYLRGSGRAPRVRSGQLDRGQFGMWFDVQHTLGVKPLDWRGFVKNTA